MNKLYLKFFLSIIILFIQTNLVFSSSFLPSSWLSSKFAEENSSINFEPKNLKTLDRNHFDSSEILDTPPKFSLKSKISNAINSLKDKIELVLEKPPVKLSFDPGIKYWLTRWVYFKAFYLAFSKSNIKFTLPLEGQNREEIVKWNNLGIPLSNVYTSQRIPYTERSTFTKFGSDIMYYLHKVLPLASHTLPEIPSDPRQLIDLSYPKEYRQLVSSPQYPLQISENLDDLIGALALAGPFAKYIKKEELKKPKKDLTYVIDLADYEKYTVKDGLFPLGGKAVLKYGPKSYKLETHSIDYSGCNYTPASKDWQLVQKILLATMSTDTIIANHLLKTHLIIGGTFSAVNNKYLSVNHPLFVLMFPHQHMTLRINNNDLKLLLGNNFEFVPQVFSYNQKNSEEIFSQKAVDFKIQSMDVLCDLTQRRMKEIYYPYADNVKRLWEIIADYVNNYVNCYYKEDDHLKMDSQIQQWYTALNTYIPNGIAEYAKKGTKEGIKKLITLFIYTASVEHGRVGSGISDYLTWHQYIPTQVRLDGLKPSIGVHQEYVNFLFGTTSTSPKLTEDFSYLALDTKGKECMQQFTQSMVRYQTELEKEEFKSYILYPQDLSTSISS